MKNQTTKRILSVLLAAIIALSCCSAAVYAVNDPIPEPTDSFMDDLDAALLEKDMIVSLMPAQELAKTAPTQVGDEITQQLRSVTKPEKGTGIAFTLKDCTFPGFSDQKFFKLLNTLGINTFSGEYRILPDGTAEIVRIDSALAILLIPSEICGKKVTSIGERAVANGLETTVKLVAGSYTVSVPSLVFLPPTVTSIGDMAFANCPRLTNVIASDSVEVIGDMAFAGCGNLRRVLFYSDVRQHLTDAATAMYEIFQKLMSSLLEDGSIVDLLTGQAVAVIKTAFEKILFYNENLKEIGKAAFYQCEELVRFYIPQAVKTVGEYAFYGCKALEKFVINSAAALHNWALAHVRIKELYIGGDISWENNTFTDSVIVKVTYGGYLKEVIDRLKRIFPELRLAVLATLEWRDVVPVSDAIDLNIYTDNAEEQKNLTFKSLDPKTASVTEDGKGLVINGVGPVELICEQEENGTLNDGAVHRTTIKTKPAEVHAELNIKDDIPYKKDFTVSLSVLKADGKDLMSDLKSCKIEWKVEGEKVDWTPNGKTCTIHCSGMDDIQITAVIRDANGNIISEATGTIGVDSVSVKVSVRLAWWQLILKIITFGLY